MQIHTVEIGGKTLKFVMLKLRAGQSAITQTGNTISDGFMGVVNIDVNQQRTNYVERWHLGIWETIDKYKAFMQKHPFSQPVNTFPIDFTGDGRGIPVGYLNNVNIDSGWLYYREINTTFFTIIMNLPDPEIEGQLVGERWEIVTT